MTLVNIQQVKSSRTKLVDFISDDDCDCSIDFMTVFCECSLAPYETLTGRSNQTLTEKSISIQNMRVHRYYRAAKDGNG